MNICVPCMRFWSNYGFLFGEIHLGNANEGHKKKGVLVGETVSLATAAVSGILIDRNDKPM